MTLLPQLLLSNAARERCLANLKELPFFTHPNARARETAAVLVPLCVDNGEVCLLYTLRSSNLKSHSGQVSFPGGKTDNNEKVVETALRETEEEIGIPRENIDIWGKMTRVRGRDKGLLITPVVGVIKNFDKLQLKPNEHEVDEVFTVSMKTLCDTNNHAHFKFEKIGLPIYLCGKYTIWGITGLITHMFLQCFLPSDVYKSDFSRQKFELDDLMNSKL